MKRQVIIGPEAAGDIEDAYSWYERARPGLGAGNQSWTN